MTLVTKTHERIIGIDPGSHRTGWGVIDAKGTKMTAVAAGVVELRATHAFERRLRDLFEELQGIFAKYKPSAIAIEDIFHARHAQSSLKLGHARGVILLAAALWEAPLAAYPPALVKKTITGSGRAEKDQVAELVMVLLSLTQKPPVDATDALAVAITHARSYALLGVTKRIGQARISP